VHDFRQIVAPANVDLRRKVPTEGTINTKTVPRHAPFEKAGRNARSPPMRHVVKLDEQGTLIAAAESVKPVPPERIRGKENGLYYATAALVNAVMAHEGEVRWKFLDESETLVGLESETLE
jgi:hypothetical protein